MPANRCPDDFRSFGKDIPSLATILYQQGECLHIIIFYISYGGIGPKDSFLQIPNADTFLTHLLCSYILDTNLMPN